MKPSKIIFGFTGVLTVVFGILYVVWPIAPYHEDIVGMTLQELTSNQPELAGLMVTLVDVVGLCFLGLGVFLIQMGRKAHSELDSWLTILVVVLVTCLPLTWVVWSVGGPFLVTVLAVVLATAGLASAFYEEK